MIRTLSSLLMLACWALKVLVVCYTVIAWLRLPENRLVSWVKRIIDPILNPIREGLGNLLPKRFQFLDWSPLVAWLLLEVAGRLISELRAIF